MNRILNVKEAPKGIIIFVDNDKDEHQLFKLAMEELGLKNKLHSFYNGKTAFEFIRETQHNIFLIYSDLNMPVMDGLQLKRIIDQTPEIKEAAIPFIFCSNSSSDAEIRAAYALNIQGFFRKSTDQPSAIENLLRILSFWGKCVHPQDLSKATKTLK